MTKVRQDFEYWTGEDKILTYTIYDAAGASVDMSGACARWVIQDEPDSGSLIVYKTAGSGVVVSGSTVKVTLAGSHTAGCAWDGQFYTELAASDSSGNDEVLAVGWANVHRRGY